MVGLRTAITACIFVCGLVTAQITTNLNMAYRLSRLERQFCDTDWNRNHMRLWVVETKVNNPDWKPTDVDEVK